MAGAEFFRPVGDRSWVFAVAHGGKLAETSVGADLEAQLVEFDEVCHVMGFPPQNPP